MGWTHLPQSPPALRVLKRVLSRWHPALWLEKLEGHQAWSTQRVRRHSPHGMFLITFFPEVKTEIVFSPSPNGGRRGQITRNPARKSRSPVFADFRSFTLGRIQIHCGPHFPHRLLRRFPGPLRSVLQDFPYLFGVFVNHATPFLNGSQKLIQVLGHQLFTFHTTDFSRATFAIDALNDLRRREKLAMIKNRALLRITAFRA